MEMVLVFPETTIHYNTFCNIPMSASFQCPLHGSFVHLSLNSIQKWISQCHVWNKGSIEDSPAQYTNHGISPVYFVHRKKLWLRNEHSTHWSTIESAKNITEGSALWCLYIPNVSARRRWCLHFEQRKQQNTIVRIDASETPMNKLRTFHTLMHCGMPYEQCWRLHYLMYQQSTNECMKSLMFPFRAAEATKFNCANWNVRNDHK